MDDLLRWAQDKMQADQALERFLLKLLKGRPDGSVNISMKGKNPRYYWLSDSQRIYLGKDKRDLAKSLAEKDYYERLLQKTREEIATLRYLIKHFDPKALIEVYEELHEQRKLLVDPLVLPDDLYAEKWVEENLKKRAARSNTFPKDRDFETTGGEFVRSKSEMLIAEIAQKLGINYVYEVPLELKDGVVFPDVTMLNLRLRKTIYLEHYGKMDDPGYSEPNIKKIHRYERSGYYLGDTLLVTMETSNDPLRASDVERLLRHYLL